jgi:hypothetical protein
MVDVLTWTVERRMRLTELLDQALAREWTHLGEQDRCPACDGHGFPADRELRGLAVGEELVLVRTVGSPGSMVSLRAMPPPGRGCGPRRMPPTCRRGRSRACRREGGAAAPLTVPGADHPAPLARLGDVGP